jgi:hypothetical protein
MDKGLFNLLAGRLTFTGNPVPFKSKLAGKFFVGLGSPGCVVCWHLPVIVNSSNPISRQQRVIIFRNEKTNIDSWTKFANEANEINLYIPAMINNMCAVVSLLPYQ